MSWASGGVGLLTLSLALMPLPALAAEPAAEEGETVAMPEAVEEILTAPDEEAYADTPRCIASGRIRDVDVIDGQHIAFKLGRDSYYLVQFERRCPQLTRNDTIAYEARGNRLCQLDSVRAVDGFGSSTRIGPPCSIPGFQAITREQLVLLKEQLKETRRGDLIDEVPEPEADADPS